MLISWTSATNAAQLYNVVLAANSSTKQPPTSNLSTDHVWDAFTILTLLEDFARQGRVLDVPHGCVQANRFFEAMAYRTSRIADIGHEMDRHYCDKCMRVFQEENGELSKIHALVVDGICIGRPCCAYQLEPCKNPLMSKHARFCAVHAPESLVCAVVTCRSAVDEGYLTCSEPAHRQLESNRRERQKAMFYLSQVHHRHGISHPANSLEPDDLADDIELPDGPEAPQQSTTFTAQDQCPDKEDESARKLRGVFGRNRTHAEVVFHRPCGIMIRRETCYKAETLTQITESLHWLEGRGLLPEVLFYDNGCRLYRSFRARNDPLFDKLALPVDVFHWKSKHKKTDIECSYHCSPYSFPELRVDATGSWYFNSSVAEQNNVWLGGYHSMLREMGEVRYNFFLDEMILRRNRLTFAKLHDYSPGTLPTT
ncbi:hypothetical protein BDP27DRAFT_1338495 [Rhodocollybia butyracea]|uniref:CxC6 like cysteine cluster associated with KDZ domain-containing protein n=1 Tax=Rhodocollybia butyracea TaxID=206335 RepID=A0A9P5PFK0_9AGAR|nr:hypothetical protein BDP27DRAFT_1338495 [Rhodocollybia butyracea]